MRVLLIDLPFYRFIGYFNRYFPLGLSSLAAAVRVAGYEVSAAAAFAWCAVRSLSATRWRAPAPR